MRNNSCGGGCGRMREAMRCSARESTVFARRRRGGLHPRRGAADSATVGQCDFIRHLTADRHVVRSAFQHPVEQIETVYMYIDFHIVFENAKAGSPRPCAASAVPWRVDARSVPKPPSAHKGGADKRF